VKRIVWTGPALRIGDYRLFFVCPDPDTIEIRRVRHRSEAYR
jgi:mRNA-degrading endonuclease RelE of RelBE toxin-antitoxin system